MQSLNILFTAPGAVELRSEAVPPLRAGEILCEAVVSLISIGTETACLRGVFEPGTMWADWVRYPFHPGYSMTARVLEVGAGVTGLRPGDRVAVSGNHRQRFTSPASEAYLLPDAISDEEGTWMLLACTTQLAVRRAALQLGERVAVVGLGLLGQLVVQYCRVAGARQVVAINRSAGRLDIAREHGATHTIAGNVAEVVEEAAQITGGRLFDAVFDVTSHTSSLASATALARRLGRVVLLGDSPTPSEQSLGRHVVSRSLAILSIHGSLRGEPTSAFHPWGAQAMAELFFDYLQQGRMRVSDLITQRHSPRDAPAVYGALLHGSPEELGIIFDWSRLA
jgi:2-desacetyl-2-hydroxyethyl bacteriochlorophyllide A dehydrogenase